MFITNVVTAILVSTWLPGQCGIPTKGSIPATDTACTAFEKSKKVDELENKF